MNYLDMQNDKSTQRYIEFLEQVQRIYYTGHFPWAEYQGFLHPAIHLAYEPPEFNLKEIKRILKLSGLPFARWSSNFTDKPTEWWWVVVKSPVNLENLSSNTRSKIRRGLKSCQVKIITADWLSKNGYQCYQKAFIRYKNVQPFNKKLFQKEIGTKKNNQYFEFFGVFFQKKLIGYTENTIVNDMVFTSDFKYQPDYLKYYPSYALTYTVLNYYLNEKKYKLVTNGTRSIAHDTKMQEFLEKFNFKKEFCKLNVVYSPLFGLLVRAVYPFRGLIDIIYKFIPINLLHKITVILKQEKIRRISYEK
jgi:hypothetical protein